MKKYSSLVVLLFVLSCTAQKMSMVKEINALNNPAPVEDSVLENLRIQNDLLILSATINTAWVKSTDYRVLAKNGNEWQGYIYHKNQMPNNKQPARLDKVHVNTMVCDSLLQFINNNKAWQISGDSGKNFCSNNNCMINDAATSQLAYITKQSYTGSTYYAPEFFEKCCGENKERSLFIAVKQKIAGLFEAAESAATR